MHDAQGRAGPQGRGGGVGHHEADVGGVQAVDILLRVDGLQELVLDGVELRRQRQLQQQAVDLAAVVEPL